MLQLGQSIALRTLGFYLLTNDRCFDVCSIGKCNAHQSAIFHNPSLSNLKLMFIAEGHRICLWFNLRLQNH